MIKWVVTRYILIFIIIFFCNFNLYAENIGDTTGYKLPRFVSLKSNDVNLRIGSSTNYPIYLKYISINLPVEIIEEYKVWRKIIDIDGNSGWIHKNLLKGNRYAIINKNNIANSKLYKKPNGNVIGEIGNFNIVKINVCLNDWCKVKFNQYKAWILKDNLWGVYKDELLNVPFYQPIINKIWKINFL